MGLSRSPSWCAATLERGWRRSGDIQRGEDILVAVAMAMSAQAPVWTYNALTDELMGHGAVSYTYDGNGNRATKVDASGTTSYSYDFENRLTRVDKPGGMYVAYAYDALGRRVKKDVNGAVTLYWYDG